MAARDEVDNLNTKAQRSGGEDREESGRWDCSSGRKVKDDDVEVQCRGGPS